MACPGCLQIFDSVSEGIANTPALYGSEVRQPGRIKDVKSGFREGGKVA